ncbi:hypothetical protein F4774DRAFT_418864 [Daldinia eschscholtzii]|nr:hypothetical protein F4774DRAFT_418864 [Daldinia eschscholtzii]
MSYLLKQLRKPPGFLPGLSRQVRQPTGVDISVGQSGNVEQMVEYLFDQEVSEGDLEQLKADCIRAEQSNEAPLPPPVKFLFGDVMSLRRGRPAQSSGFYSGYDYNGNGNGTNGSTSNHSPPPLSSPVGQRAPENASGLSQSPEPQHVALRREAWDILQEIADALDWAIDEPGPAVLAPTPLGSSGYEADNEDEGFDPATRPLLARNYDHDDEYEYEEVQEEDMGEKEEVEEGNDRGGEGEDEDDGDDDDGDNGPVSRFCWPKPTDEILENMERITLAAEPPLPLPSPAPAPPPLPSPPHDNGDIVSPRFRPRLNRPIADILGNMESIASAADPPPPPTPPPPTPPPAPQAPPVPAPAPPHIYPTQNPQPGSQNPLVRILIIPAETPPPGYTIDPYPLYYILVIPLEPPPPPHPTYPYI